MTTLEDSDDELIKRSGWLRGIVERGRGEGRREAIEAMLSRLFARRLGRALQPEEREALARRAGVLGPERVEDVGLDLEREALAAWLADPSAR